MAKRVPDSAPNTETVRATNDDASAMSRLCTYGNTFYTYFTSRGKTLSGPGMKAVAGDMLRVYSDCIDAQ